MKRSSVSWIFREIQRKQQGVNSHGPDWQAMKRPKTFPVLKWAGHWGVPPSWWEECKSVQSLEGSQH